MLAPHYESLSEKQSFLRDIFDRSARHYEGIARWGFFGTGQWYRREVLKRKGLKPGMQVLDVATGTGPTARAVAEVVGDPTAITCLEPSRGMLTESRRLLPTASYVQAGADFLPFADASFDFLTMGFALRHVSGLASAFAEFYRVLRPGGKVLILDVTKPAGSFAVMMWKFYFRDLMPRLTRIFTKSDDAAALMRYYWDTMEFMVPPADVLAALTGAGFQKVERELSLGVFSEYQGIKDGDAPTAAASVPRALESILRCPVTKGPLHSAGAAAVSAFNARVALGEVRSSNGRVVSVPATGLYLTSDGTRSYVVREGVPIFLPEEAIAEGQEAR